MIPHLAMQPGVSPDRAAIRLLQGSGHGHGVRMRRKGKPRRAAGAGPRLGPGGETRGHPGWAWLGLDKEVIIQAATSRGRNFVSPEVIFRKHESRTPTSSLIVIAGQLAPSMTMN